MKRITALICALAGAIAVMQAQPEIAWQNTKHNFGAFDEADGPVTCRFVFTNTGDSPLTITAARASCGCTQPRYPREAVAPGDTASITVTYDPAGRPGRFSKSIYVDSDAKTDHRSRLLIEGVVVGTSETLSGRYPVDFGNLKMRTSAIMFGQVSKPHLKNVFIEAYNRSSDSIRPALVKAPDYITVNFEPKTVGPGEQFTIICYFNSAKCKTYGLVEDSVSLSVGDRVDRLPFVAIVNEDFSRLTAKERAKAPVCRPESETLDFGRIAAGSGKVSLSTDICNDGDNQLEIRRVYTVDPGVTVSIDRDSIKRGKKATLTVTVDRDALPGSLLNARISLITNDPQKPVRTIRAVGEL